LFLQNSVLALLIYILVFPPSMFAGNISWTGGDNNNNWSDPRNWGCTSSCGSTPASTDDATIGFGANITFDPPSATVGSLTLTASGVLNIGTPAGAPVNHSLTMGTPNTTFPTNVLTVSNGGVLNISNGGSAVLELSGGASALNDAGGTINVNDGGTLTLQNAFGTNAAIVNNGSINVQGTSTTAPASLLLNYGTFEIDGTGTLTLDGTGNIATDP